MAQHLADAVGDELEQALAALLFLYRSVLGVELTAVDDVLRARKPRRLPVVLDRSEVQALLGAQWEAGKSALT